MRRRSTAIGGALGTWLAVSLALAGTGRTAASQAGPSLLESLTGRDSFAQYCSPCHGATGTGDGPVSAALRTAPADLTTLARRNDGRFPRERVVAAIDGTGRVLSAHGSTDMPVWGTLFLALDPSDARVRQRIENLATYVESIQVASTGPGDEGSRLFRTYCASCHGTDARGMGPMADHLRHAPPDLTQFASRNGGVFPSERVFRIVDGRDVASHGDRDMPVWGDAFRTSGGLSASAVRARISAIVKYLEAIQERPA